jgi:eukaryotic-like serine/threonine-protein kinase
VVAPDGATRVLVDRYELHQKLGSGGAGTVWRGHDRALDRPVAVKLLHADLADDPAAETRFRTEATAAAKLTHPHAVLVYDLGRDDGDDYLVMELVDGASLADVLHDGPLPAGLAAAVAEMVAGALGTAHRHGVVHRDVKPGNVLITTDGAAKLADFGIARALGDVSARLTRTGTVLGTARYLAPEQLRDDVIDARADVYALGLVLHEMLTGRAPFGEGNPVEVAARRLTTTLPSPGELVDGVPSGLDELVRWATQVDPHDRPEDGRAFAAALRSFAAADAPTALASRVARVPVRTTTPARGRAGAGRDRPGSGGADPGSREAAPDPADTSPVRRPDPDAHVPPADADGAVARSATQALPVADAAPPGVPAVASPTGRTPGTPPRPDPRTGTGAGTATSALDADAVGNGGDGGDVAEVATDRTEKGSGLSVAARVILAVVVLSGIGLAIGLVTSSAGDDEAPPEEVASDDGAPDEDTADAPEEVDAAALTITDAGDHDPLGDDLEERPEDIPAAFDGDLDTSWPTSGYSSADFGNLKDGVGMWVQLDDPAELDRVEVTLGSAGGALQLYVGEGAPDPDQVPDDWGQLIGEGPIPEDDVAFRDLPDGTEADTLLLWFTELPEGDGAFRGEIREVRVFGR